MNTRTLDIVIVGGGFSGTMLAVQLALRAPSLSIAVVDKGGLPGRGLAYGTEYQCHVLNVPAANMSALADDSEHFLRWARAHHHAAIQPRTFLPRALYGRYVGSLFEQAQKGGNADRLRWIQDEALSLRREHGHFAVELRNGLTLLTQSAVIATGNFPPGNPNIAGLSERSERYIGYAWANTALQSVPRSGCVLLIGSGLTSLDLAIGLRFRGFKGNIHILSRRGLIPQPHQRTAPWPPFWNEGSPKTTRGLLRLIRSQVRAAAGEGVDWRAVIDALRPATQKIWQSLPTDEQRRFLRHVRSYWEVHRHRIAPEIGDVISDLIEDGQVRIHAGRITKYAEEPESAVVTYRSRRNGRQHTLRVDRVINCTGSETDCRRIDSSLISSLFAQGLARPDPSSLGLDVDANCALMDCAGVASQFLYAMGPVVKGCLWEITAVPDIRRQVSQLAEHLMSTLFHEVPIGPRVRAEAALRAEQLRH